MRCFLVLLLSHPFDLFQRTLLLRFTPLPLLLFHAQLLFQNNLLLSHGKNPLTLNRHPTRILIISLFISRPKHIIDMLRYREQCYRQDLITPSASLL